MEELINKFQAWQILIQTAHNSQKRGAIGLDEAGNVFEAVKIGESELQKLQQQIQQEQEKAKAKEADKSTKTEEPSAKARKAKASK
jgi:hypothetical protein